MLRQPIQRYTQMQATDIDIYRNELRRLKTNLVSGGDMDKDLNPGQTEEILIHASFPCIKRMVCHNNPTVIAFPLQLSRCSDGQ